MFASISAKELEKRAFRSTFQDGIWDIYLGMLLLLMGMSVALSRITSLPERTLGALMLVITIFVMIGFFAGKKYITTPRMGVVKFSAERKKKVMKVRVVLSLSALMGLAIFLGIGRLTSLTGTLPDWIAPLGLFGITSIVVFSLGAWYLDYTRAYLYGWCYALAFPVGIFLQNSTIFGFLISYAVFSLVMIVPGIILLVRFVREHPVPGEGMTGGELNDGFTESGE